MKSGKRTESLMRKHFQHAKKNRLMFVSKRRMKGDTCAIRCLKVCVCRLAERIYCILVGMKKEGIYVVSLLTGETSGLSWQR